MSTLEAQRFEPVYLQPEECRITEYGKRWFEARYSEHERFNSTLRDVAKLAIVELWKWPRIQRQLELEGVPTAVSSGMSKYAMGKLIDYVNDKNVFTQPTTIAMALCVAPAPTSSSTGASITEASYTGYARQTIAAAGFNAASAADPTVATNASTITFGNCTAGTATLVGFLIADSATVAAGNALWYGTLTSTVISTTQTPPTVAAGALSLSATGT